MPERGTAPLIAFLWVAFGGSLLFSLTIGLSGGSRSSLLALAPLTMLLPALGVLVVRSRFGVRLDIEWKRLPLRWLPLALLALPVAIHAVALPGAAVLVGRLPWAHWLTPGPDGLYHTPQERGWGTLTAPHLAVRIAANAVVGVLAVSFLAFFEEIGWRAFLLPRLVKRYGVHRAAAASALIWALWHVPFALSGIQHIERISPLVLAITYPVGIFGAGLFLAFLWLKTGSILLVSLAHGSLNNWGQYAFKYMSTMLG